MRRVALIVGAGDATGGALARRFAREGMVVAIRPGGITDKLQELAADQRVRRRSARHAGGRSRRSRCRGLARRCEELGELELVVHNIGANVRFAAHETTERVFRKVWELACLSPLLAARAQSRWPSAAAAHLHRRDGSVRGASTSPPSPPEWRANVRSRRAWRRSSTARRPRGARRGRRRDRDSVCPRSDGRRGLRGGKGSGRSPRARGNRRHVLPPASNRARRGVRAGPAASLRGAVVEPEGKGDNNKQWDHLGDFFGESPGTRLPHAERGGSSSPFGRRPPPPRGAPACSFGCVRRATARPPPLPSAATCSGHRAADPTAFGRRLAPAHHGRRRRLARAAAAAPPPPPLPRRARGRVASRRRGRAGR